MLYIISTPIGNLKDISIRTLEILENIDVLLCEDTRKTGILLQNLKIGNKPKMESFYDEVEQQKIPKILEMLKEGIDIGLTSDAGTPLISDPGWLLVKKCQESGIKYTALPGACAAINAVVLSGLPMQRFCFLGFLPKKENDIRKLLNKYKTFEGVKVVYEAGNRLKGSVVLIKEVFGEKVDIRIIREMTKIYEEILKPGELLNDKGEAVIVWS